MTLGFVGTGTITAAIVSGLRAAGDATPILLSPRNAEVAADLAARFAGVTVAPTNQAVLDGSEVVVLAVRPQVAAEVLPALSFRPDHRVLSLIAAHPLAKLKMLTAPAGMVVRAAPLPPVARRQGPTAIFPPDPEAKALFDQLGVAIELDDEADFDAFTTATAVMASYFTFADTVCEWMGRQHIAPAKAHAFVAQMFLGLAGAPEASPEASFAKLADEHQTRGGLNEQVVNQMRQGGAFANLEGALDSVLKRVKAG